MKIRFRISYSNGKEYDRVVEIKDDGTDFFIYGPLPFESIRNIRVSTHIEGAPEPLGMAETAKTVPPGLLPVPEESARSSGKPELKR